MHPQLLAVADEFRAAQRRLHVLAARISPEQWAVRPAPDRWSVAECVEHLNLTSLAYIPLLDRAVVEARELGAPAPARYRRDPIGWLLWRTMAPPVRFRMPTIPAMVPHAVRPPAELLGEFDRLQEEQLRIVAAADGLALQRIKLVSPFSAKMRYNAFSALTMLPPHQERHIWQAGQGRDQEPRPPWR